MNNIQATKQSALALAEYTLDGGQKLTAETIKRYICPDATEQEILYFLELCKAQKLNPFIRDAYLVKYGSQPAQIIVGKDVFIKKAHASGVLRYIKAGIVVADKDRNIIEREGTIKFDDEILLGGWCEVSRTDREFPTHRTVNFQEYVQRKKDGTTNSMWSSKPCTMIRKVAQTQTLREAFTDELQGLYEQEEMGIENKLPEKEVKVGYATTGQKQGIMKLASMKGLYDYDNPKDISKMQEFCESNGYCLKELKYEEVDELLDLLSKYEPKEEVVIDTEFTEVVEEPQQTVLEV